MQRILILHFLLDIEDSDSDDDKTNAYQKSLQNAGN